MLKLKVLYYISKIEIFFLNKLSNGKISIGQGTHWRKSMTIIVESGSVSIGKNCFFNNYCSVTSLDSIVIGDNCLFGEGVQIYDHNHIFRQRDKSIVQQGFSTDSIKIGNNCWIGSNVVILKGVELGDHVIIGANCLIYKSIPSNTIVTNDSKLLIRSI